MRARLYLHVGLHKTGTTSLQRALRINEDGLARKGVGYVVAGRGRANAHHDFALKVKGIRAKPAMATLLAPVAEELLASPARTHVMSSEVFDQCTDDVLRWFLQCLNEAGIATHAVLVLRNHQDLMKSVYSQQLKQGLTGRSLEAFQARIDANRNRPSDLSYVHYDVFLARMLDVFGRAHVHVLDFAALFGPGVAHPLGAFLEAIHHGGVTDLVEAPQANRTMSLEKLSFMAALAEAMDGKEPVPACYNRLRKVSGRLEQMGGLAQTKFRLPVTADHQRLCDQLHDGLSGISIPDLARFCPRPELSEGTPLLPLTAIPDAHFRAFSKALPKVHPDGWGQEAETALAVRRAHAGTAA